MANIPLKSIQFPDLADTYTVPSNAGELPYDKSATYPADTVGKALQDKPDADGTIANAEQLTSNIYEEDNTPYNFRTSGGSIDIGDRETDMVVGGTLAWNQLVKNGNFANTNNWIGQHCSISASGNVLTAEATAENVAGRIEQEVTLIAGHKYLFKENIKVSANATSRFAYRYSGGIKYTASLNATANTWGEIATVFSADTQGDSGMLYLYYSNSTALAVGGTAQYKNVILFDLTQMFGSTIADYIYSLETATAGAGVAWFKKLFPKPYYTYNAGELMSVNTSSHNTTGFNQWDEEWENGSINANGEKVSGDRIVRSKNYISCLGGATYYQGFKARFGSDNIVTYFYDANKNFVPYIGYGAYNGAANPPNGLFTAPTDARYMLFRLTSDYGATYNHDICINLHWDGERDGEYEPYVKHEYALDDSLTLRGIPKLDASNNLYYDGDTYESDGTVTRRYGIVDLGTLTWTYESENQAFRTVLNPTQKNAGNGVCTKYLCLVGGLSTMPDKCFGLTGTQAYPYLRIKDSAYTDAVTFKTAMSGVYLVYELATPTTETADPYTNPQIVNDFGTEEYVDYAVSQGTRDVAIPVGHETQYMANLKAKLEMSPNSPEGAGDYIVRQTNGENEYVTLASNATIQNIISRIEALENAES